MACDDLEEWDGGGQESSRELIYIYIHIHIQLIHFIVQRKLTQHCKGIILQLKFLKVIGSYSHRKKNLPFYYYNGQL